MKNLKFIQNLRARGIRIHDGAVRGHGYVSTIDTLPADPAALGHRALGFWWRMPRRTVGRHKFPPVVNVAGPVGKLP